MNERRNRAGNGPCAGRREARQERVDALDQQRRRHRTAERIASFSGEVGKAEEPERDQHAEAQEREQESLLEHVEEERLELGHYGKCQCCGLF